MATASAIDNRENKRARLENTEGQELSRRAYNLLIGTVVCFGLIVNAAMVQYLPASVYNYMYSSTAVVIFGFLVVAIGATVVIYASDSAAVSFIAFVFLSAAFGFLVASVVHSYTDVTVTRAFVTTAAITVCMLALGTAFPQVFAKMGGALFTMLLISIIAEILTMVITHTDPVIFDWIFVIIFSLYIAYDWQAAQKYPPTANNAVDSAADIFIDIMNLFIRLLAIFSRDN